MRSLAIVGCALIGLTLSSGPALPADPPQRATDSTGAPSTLEEIVVTAPRMQLPLETQFNPKSPQQPLPAQDGAAFLKSVPGMSVIRKGGTDGDPVFRGMAGSRLGILLDGETILGGCGMRMDPPTAYVHPETYDRITVLKGPQSVIHGPSNSAGVVLFERDHRQFERPGVTAFGSVVGGSFGRHGEVLDVTAGAPLGYVRGIGSYSHSDNYEDGDGRRVHSKYSRWSGGAAVGWTPTPDTRLELTTTQSDGEAAYADRSMDGVAFTRQNYGLKFETKRLPSWIDAAEAQVYYNYIDHVMDNFSLRTFAPSVMLPNRSVSNPDRETVGGRMAFTVRPFTSTTLIFGMDAQLNWHTLRSTRNERTTPYEAMPRTADARFAQYGLFAEWTQWLGDSDRLVAGGRADWWQGRDKRRRLSLTPLVSVPNPTANRSKDDTLPSGFIRLEHDVASLGMTLFGGIGHLERYPDYWELVSASKEGPAASDLSAFATTRPERTTQLDVGLTWEMGSWSGSVSGFANSIEDFILIQSGVARVAPVRTVSTVRNIDATTWGGEAGLRYSLSSQLKLDSSVAYVHGQNDTEERPLAQIPPLEGRIGATWSNGTWSIGALLRLVAPQHRFALNQGNIVGQDLGRSAGFAVLSVNGAWTPIKGLVVAAGFDNLLDATYAEHISRSGAIVTGFEQTTRVNEPGRTVWARASYLY